MAIVAHDPALGVSSTWPSPEAVRILAPMLRLLVNIWVVESVQRIALASDGSHVDLWVLTRDEVPADEERIALAEREYLSEVGPSAFDLHVAPLSRIDQALLPPAETILER